MILSYVENCLNAQMLTACKEKVNSTKHCNSFVPLRLLPIQNLVKIRPNIFAGLFNYVAEFSASSTTLVRRAERKCASLIYKFSQLCPGCGREEGGGGNCWLSGEVRTTACYNYHTM